ncbi:molybdate ABC transporter substrate-binding protein [Thiolapillus sp.]
MRLLLLVFLLLSGCGQASRADEIHIAVASNFAVAARQLARRFEMDTGHEVSLSPGSTGKQYAQIRHGAPFHAWLAADSRRPEQLEREGRIQPGSRFTYARGRLVLWSPDPELVDARGEVLRKGDFRHLAIANPRLAPYGLAARQLLQKLGLWQVLAHRLVQGENIGQAFRFVRSGNAELGLVAASQVLPGSGRKNGSFWVPPADLYEPIEQQAVLLRDNEAARAFLAFVAGDEGRAIIGANGYQLP